jgi:hypothetical protein
MGTWYRAGGAKQSPHRGGGLTTPRAGAAHAAHHAAGADGLIGKPACLRDRGSVAAPMARRRLSDVVREKVPDTF